MNEFSAMALPKSSFFSAGGDVEGVDDAQ